MKLKKNKIKLKYIFFLIITYFIFSYTFYYSFKEIASANNNKLFINFLLNNGNANYVSDYKIPKIINGTMNYFFNIDFSTPVSLFNENIIGYTEEESDEDEFNSLKEISSYIEDPSDKEVDNPLIYIYNTHQLENYNNYSLEVYGITPNVLMASYLLREKLNEKNIPTIVEETDMSKFLSLNKWSYSNSYRASRIFMLDKKNMYPSIKYFIDIHRDSVGKNVSTTKINGKSYAKILFVVGLEHKKYKDNLDFATKLNNLFNSKYPGISRGILKKEGKNVDGIYNQDISPYVALIEVGGVDNNINEVLNTINAISEVFSIYIDKYEK